ncbi:hypothetical protein BN7_2585 [Wickerhamomyces ciferrii]|uniref:acetyl-CoA C-acyltransferase n=1 Tax=Wickerhamomyces ciferrii (strain ATCC 14091 / BCRC 22168 / CBS 111 / JCM 3599 / NBRC 0793 / NRRL Y-1031 F-60-10) TaxID=1206466 RepID=K0KPG4_WICCF|nr:uncharacterized protein BN7_2585 [Wickerhamomyces ciferrii]CCH43038.1 hypothetical protein BN7_2585 [Wickerhamomyces ciferrii]
MERLNQLKNHIVSPKAQVTTQKDDDVVIVAAYRTAIGKGFKGSFKDTQSDELLQKFLVQFFNKVNIDPSLIEDVACGNVLNIGAGATEHRAACLAAGIPDTAGFLAINRQCSSSLTAVNDIANKIKVGQIKVGLALGSESMSRNYGPKLLGTISKSILLNEEGKKCGIPMGITNENISSNFQITRETQDEFAANSYIKAEKASSSGLFQNEILPIEVEIKLPQSEEDEEDEKPPQTKKVTVSKDEGPRSGVTPQSLSKIKPAFKKNGTTHAGNASQVSDGAAGVLLMRRDVAKDLGLPILGKYINFKCVGVPPEIMGVGPAYAIPAVLSAAGLSVDDIDIFEINEAFAGQALYSIHKVGIDINKVNPRGGAIALGHPLATTGARQVATLFRELEKGQIGVTSMCIGTGMGAAAIFVKE